MGSHPNSLDDASQCLSTALSQNRFECEIVRLASFSQCPQTFRSFSTMAAAGFIYKNEQIKCFKCRIILPGDLYYIHDMVDTHKRISPCCSFIQSIGNRTTSVRCNVSPEEIYVHNVYNQGEQQRCEETTAKIITIDSGYSSSMQTGSVPAAEQPSTGLSCQELSTGRTSQKKWNSFTVRQNSFLGWPKEVPSPDDLATAGFYYTGSGDHVKCFCCELELAKWEPNDVPWTEHARQFSDCDYVKKNMPPQQDQPSHESKEIGAVACVAQPVEDITEYDMELSRQSGSTISFQEEYNRPYIESTAARAVLEMATSPNAKRHVEKILDALCYEPNKQPTVVQIMGVLLIIEEQEKEHDKTKENHDREKRALYNEIEDLKSKILCGICCASVRNMVLCPCSHFFCCEPCVSKIQEEGGQCPVCRSRIERSQKIYLP
ncbi:baculoviral IAP repeat-containing protein 8-like [Mytilus edulis]|uniref:baculoviral IAP repeat-containing protein 8-like n=1 Tax=Mytilus edulis TaxID=6550 RepID=UPI0039EFA5B5